MKGIDEELGNSEPEGLHDIFERGPLHLHIAFRAEMIDFFLSMLIHDAVVHAIWTKIHLTIGAHPMGLLGRMIVTKRCHVYASLCQN
jgi:hypothetical protein